MTVWDGPVLCEEVLGVVARCFYVVVWLILYLECYKEEGQHLVLLL